MKCTLAALALSGLGLAAIYPASTGNPIPEALVQFVHGHAGDHNADVGAHLEQIATRLELSTAQRAEIASIFSGTALLDDAKLLLERHSALAEAVHSETFDEAVIRELSAPVGAAQADVAVSLARLMQDVHGVLTEEQLTLAASLHPNIHARIQKHISGFEASLVSWIEENE